MGEEESNENSPVSGSSSVRNGIAEFESIFVSKRTPEREDGSRRGANQTRSTRRALGRGLSALMSVGEVEVEPSRERPVQGTSNTTAAEDAAVSAGEAEAPEGGLLYLSIERLKPNEDQPRRYFPAEDIASLSRSIKESGLLQPIMVRRVSGEVGAPATYEIVAGERRWRAAKDAGLTRVPALVRQLTDRETLEIGIIENVQRSDLNPIEEAQAYQRLIDDFEATQEEVARTVGKDRASIANTLRLLKLVPEVQQLLIEKKLSAGHGRALLMAAEPAEQLPLAEVILAEGLTVRAAEKLAAGGSPTSSSTPSRSGGRGEREEKAPSIVALEERFRRALGTKVQLEMKKSGKGELKISFFSEQELESLIEKVGA